MIKINDKNKAKCSGCSACVDICPKHCISMVPDKEGFWYPVVDEHKCVKCGLCKNICSSIKSFKSENNSVAYACYNLDEETRKKSSSGGMFTIIAESILDLGGAVFGAAFAEDLSVYHICVDNKGDLYKLRGSKYIQSVVSTTYKQVEKILKTGRLVLFSGTPCQVTALLQYLGEEYDNLYTMDIICHGVASLNIWKAYLEHLEALYKSKVDATSYPSFRSKREGYLDFGMEVLFENGAVHSENKDNDVFLQMYLYNLMLRPSCYQCNFKGVKRNADITLADFWGVDKIMPEMFDNKGTSFVMVNTQKGSFLFDKAKKNSVCKEADIKKAVQHNWAAVVSPPKPFFRKKVFDILEDSAPTDFFGKINYNRSFFEKVYQKLKYTYKKHTVKY